MLEKSAFLASKLWDGCLLEHGCLIECSWYFLKSYLVNTSIIRVSNSLALSESAGKELSMVVNVAFCGML